MIDRVQQDIKGRMVLVVDDDPRLRSYIKAVLQSEGVQVVEAGEGLEALVVFHKSCSSVEMVVTDIRMPCMTGVDLAVSLRSIRPSIPIIFISGEAARAGMNDPKNGFIFIEKPFTPKALLDAATQLVNWSRWSVDEKCGGATARAKASIPAGSRPQIGLTPR